ncbi:MaoC family dehydratase [Martelella lutilitoris]|uniref:MaoC family dehydratase n=1 Tax=Martelella lutilitoris TaxID=2583532 RepID=A0A7T7KKM1_9HYPH|nr:MaoC family dehydratase [Martelella lutilitoris]QQM29796.1 MaoC family dehydratase [Martelella lutilitoris]
MLIVDHARDLAAHEGQLLGRSAWMTVTQEAIDDYARLTGDDHWIHVDVERAAREMPGGKTIAHGLFIISLQPALQREIYQIRARGRGLNYGYDRMRFIAPVPVESRIRLALTLVAAEPHALGTRIVNDAVIELEGSEKPAIATRHIVLIENDPGDS